MPQTNEEAQSIFAFFLKLGAEDNQCSTKVANSKKKSYCFFRPIATHLKRDHILIRISSHLNSHHRIIFNIRTKTLNTLNVLHNIRYTARYC